MGPGYVFISRWKVHNLVNLHIVAYNMVMMLINQTSIHYFTFYINKLNKHTCRFFNCSIVFNFKFGINQNKVTSCHVVSSFGQNVYMNSS